jgi:hypothetical protein
MSSHNLEPLIEAIARGAGIVLSLPSAGLVRHHKSRFLAETEDGFLVEAARGEGPLVQELIKSLRPIGVSFKSGPTKAVFVTPLLRRIPQFRINAQTVVDALQLSFPSEVKVIQRRNNYRVVIPLGCDLTVKVWRIAEKAYLRARPMAAQALKCTVRDMSIGGLGVTLESMTSEPARVGDGQRLRIEMTFGGIALLFEGRTRKPSLPPPGTKPDNRIIRTGITFKHLEKEIDGRQTLAALTRIVGTLQRDEIRRYRMGPQCAA